MSKRAFIGCGSQPKNTIGRFAANRTFDLREHPLLARFDELEVAEPECVLPDQRQHQAVAVVAGLDAVDLVVELGGEALDVAKSRSPASCRYAGTASVYLAPFRFAPTTSTEPSAWYGRRSAAWRASSYRERRRCRGS